MSAALIQLIAWGHCDSYLLASDAAAAPSNLRQSALYWWVNREDGFATPDDLKSEGGDPTWGATCSTKCYVSDDNGGSAPFW